MSATRSSAEPVLAARPAFGQQDLAQIMQSIEGVLKSGRLILGENTLAFEQAYRNYVGTKHAVAVSTCSAALQIVTRFFAVQGREVILPTNNFPGVVSGVLYEGGIPVLAEMDPNTFGLDVDDAIARVTPKTRGMIVVHIAGLVNPDIDRLRQYCQQRELFLIEDASHAHGAMIDGRQAGSLADAGCFSFYPTKIITSGTGGMITTDNPELADFARSLRHHGQGRKREQFIQPGNDWCMSEIHAVIGLQQLKRLEEHVAHRNQVVQWYREGLADCDWLTIPEHDERLRHAYYKLPTLLDPNIDRDLFRRTLEEEFQIQNGTIYDPPCHLQMAFRDHLRLQEGALPIAEAALKRQFCPPIHSTISQAQVNHVIQVTKSLVDRCRKTG